MQRELLGIVSVDFEAAFQLLIVHCALVIAGVFNAWPAGPMWPAEPFAVARRPV
jgi:hypothetical protein